MQIILAPSGCGKTRAVETLGYAVDGDVVIATSIGWPQEHKWWKGPQAPAVHIALEAALREYYERESSRKREGVHLPKPVIVFNGYIELRESDYAVTVPSDPYTLYINDLVRVRTGRRAEPVYQDYYDAVDQWLDFKVRYGHLRPFSRVEDAIEHFIGPW